VHAAWFGSHLSEWAFFDRGIGERVAPMDRSMDRAHVRMGLPAAIDGRHRLAEGAVRTERSSWTMTGATMTWKALVQHLLQRASSPALVLDTAGQIQIVNSWLELAVDRPNADLSRRSFVDDVVAPEDRGEATRQMGEIHRGERSCLRTRIVRRDGCKLDAVLQATLVGPYRSRLLVLEGEVIERSRQVPRVPGMEVYEISSARDSFGEIRYRWPDGGVGETCHALRYQRGQPCPLCPARNLRPDEPGVTTVIRMEGEAWYDLVTAQHAGPALARVGVVRVTDDALSELMETRFLRLAQERELSEREQVVLQMLLLGRTIAEIGTALGISARTVKFHQKNVLDKLGAKSRVDLLRVFL
jgi:DNA-binding CsgD family transcriptional regulator